MNFKYCDERLRTSSVTEQNSVVRILYVLQMSKFAGIVSDAIDAKVERLHELGRYLWENPELMFEERKAHDYITNFLEKEGFPVQKHYILPTAFRAEFGGKSRSCIPIKYWTFNEISGHPTFFDIIITGHQTQAWCTEQ